MFLHDVILEALKTVPAEDVKEKMTDLANVEPKTGKAGVETKYEVAVCINIIRSYCKHGSYVIIIVELV